MTTVIVELYAALRAAGAPEDKAQAAARALAEHDRRFDHVDTEFAPIRGELKALEGAGDQVNGSPAPPSLASWP